MLRRQGVQLGQDAKARGVSVLLAPGANIHRNPLCGRNFEYYSEDPFLTGKVAAAMINGIESNGVGASLKHFAVNNQEYNRLANNSILSERTLREIYLRNFEIAVKESQPWTIMTSYNFINGEHASESTRLLTDILRDEWDFEGVVMTDWAAGYDQAQIVRAGNEMIQPGSNRRYKQLKAAIEDGSLSMTDVDRAVERILQLVVKTPKFKGYKSRKFDRSLNCRSTNWNTTPGESCEVCIYISKESLASYNEAISAWQTDEGTYTFVAAQDAMDNSLKTKVKVD